MPLGPFWQFPSDGFILLPIRSTLPYLYDMPADCPEDQVKSANVDDNSHRSYDDLSCPGRHEEQGLWHLSM